MRMIVEVREKVHPLVHPAPISQSTRDRAVREPIDIIGCLGMGAAGFEPATSTV
jgi:hypothetical protein